jgi:hypothetical protein
MECGAFNHCHLCQTTGCVCLLLILDVRGGNSSDQSNGPKDEEEKWEVPWPVGQERLFFCSRKEGKSFEEKVKTPGRNKLELQGRAARARLLADWQSLRSIIGDQRGFNPDGETCQVVKPACLGSLRAKTRKKNKRNISTAWCSLWG